MIEQHHLFTSNQLSWLRKQSGEKWLACLFRRMAAWAFTIFLLPRHAPGQRAFVKSPFTSRLGTSEVCIYKSVKLQSSLFKVNIYLGSAIFPHGRFRNHEMWIFDQTTDFCVWSLGSLWFWSRHSPLVHQDTFITSVRQSTNLENVPDYERRREGEELLFRMCLSFMFQVGVHVTCTIQSVFDFWIQRTRLYSCHIWQEQ